MVTVKDKVFYIYGPDFSSRKLTIENIKKKILQESPGSLNVLNFYPKEINIKDLQEKILLSSFDKKKILIFKDIYNLPKEIRDFLFNNFNRIISGNYLIFEAESNPPANKKVSTDKFFSFILAKAACYKAGLARYKASFEDFKKSLRQANASQAIYVLDKLFEDKVSESERKTLGLQLFGVLVSESSYLKNSALRKKYLNYLWQADREIKERGFDPRFAIEIFLSRCLAA